MAMLVGQIFLCSFPALYLNCFYVKRVIGYGLKRQFLDNGRLLLSASVLAVAVAGVGYGLLWSPWIEFVLQVSMGAGLFLMLSWLLKDPSFREGVKMIQSRIERSAE